MYSRLVEKFVVMHGTDKALTSCLTTQPRRALYWPSTHRCGPRWGLFHYVGLDASSHRFGKDKDAIEGWIIKLSPQKVPVSG